MTSLLELFKHLVLSVGNPEELARGILGDVWEDIFTAKDTENLFIQSLQQAIIEEAGSEGTGWTPDDLKKHLKYKIEIDNIQFQDLTFDKQKSAFAKQLELILKNAHLINSDRISSNWDYEQITYNIIQRTFAKFLDLLCKRENIEIFNKKLIENAKTTGSKIDELFFCISSSFPQLNGRLTFIGGKLEIMSSNVSEILVEVLNLKEEIAQIKRVVLDGGVHKRYDLKISEDEIRINEKRLDTFQATLLEIENKLSKPDLLDSNQANETIIAIKTLEGKVNALIQELKIEDLIVQKIKQEDVISKFNDVSLTLKALLEKREKTQDLNNLDIQFEKQIFLHQKQYECLADLLIRQKNDAPVYGEMVIVKSPQEILDREFVNRRTDREELEKLNGIPYIQIFAPAGYGKTYLLSKLRATFSTKYKWVTLGLSFHINLAARYSEWQVIADLLAQFGIEPNGDLEDITTQLTNIIADKGAKVALFLDGIETAQLHVLGWIEDSFLDRLQSPLRIKTVRAFFASRYEIERARRLGHRYDTRRLSNFRESDIREMLEYFINEDNKDLEIEEIDFITKNLYQLTLGIPKCVNKIINHLRPTYNPRRTRDLENFFEEKRFFREYVKKVIHKEILAELESEKLDALKVMSTFRAFTPATIRALIKQNYLKFNEYLLSFDLIGFIRYYQNLGLVIPPNQEYPSMYQIDPVVRHALNLENKLEDETTYRHLHEFAMDIYSKWTNQKDENGKKDPAPTIASEQLLYIREYLYHLCKYMQVTNSTKSDSYKSLVSKLEKLLRKLLPAPHGMPRETNNKNLKALISRDSELLNEITEVVGEDGVVDLLNLIDNFGKNGGPDEI